MGRDDPLRLRDLLVRMELVFVCIHLLFWKANKLENEKREKKQDGKECCYKYGHRAYSFRVISGGLFLLYNNIVNSYTIQDLIPQFEYIINKIKPAEIYIPVPSYNQDHRIVYEAALTALRPHDVNFFVKKVFVYEQIQDLWNHNYHPFNPTYFRVVDIEQKIESYHLLKSQVRSFRSADMLRNLAALRGIQSNTNYAEGFEILRWID